MEQEPDQKKSGRENLLTVALVLLVGGLSLFFLWLISLGVVGNVIAGVVIFIIIGALHYLVWGRAFTQEVEAERDALRRQEKQSPVKVLERAAPPIPVVTIVEEKSDAIQDKSHAKAMQKKDGDVS